MTDADKVKQSTKSPQKLKHSESPAQSTIWLITMVRYCMTVWYCFYAVTCCNSTVLRRILQNNLLWSCNKPSRTRAEPRPQTHLGKFWAHKTCLLTTISFFLCGPKRCNWRESAACYICKRESAPILPAGAHHCAKNQASYKIVRPWQMYLWFSATKQVAGP